METTPITNAVDAEAAARGLTPEILESILRGENK